VNKAKGPVESKKELKDVKKGLMARKQELEEHLTSRSTEQISDGQVQDIGDQALTSIMESLRTSLQDAEVDEYKRIAKALEMIEQGVYGICTDCKEAISPKRLKLFPDAVRCLICQEVLEEGSP